MATKAQKLLNEEFQLTGANAKVFYGMIAGFYTLVICDENQNKATVTIGVKNAAAHPALYEQLSSLTDELKIKNHTLSQHTVDAVIQGSLIKPYHNSLSIYLKKITDFLASNNYESGCYLTGEDDGTVRFAKVNDLYLFLSQQAYDDAISELKEKKEQIIHTGENYLLGIIGAGVGAIIGGAIWAIIGILGFYAWLTGFATIFLSFYGYKRLGKKVGKIGSVIVFLFSVSAIFAGSVVEWAWRIYQEVVGYFEVTFFEVLSETLPIIFENPEIRGGFLTDIGIGIGIVFVLGIPLIINMYSENSGNYNAKQFD